MSVRANVELPLRAKRLRGQRRDELVSEALDAVGLGDVHGAYLWQLSGGMQQRVAIARAVAYEPYVLLMDEPFAAVDAQTRAELEDLVRSVWHRTGVTTLFVTHDIDEAVYLGQRVLVLSPRPPSSRRTSPSTCLTSGTSSPPARIPVHPAPHPRVRPDPAGQAWRRPDGAAVA